MLRRWLGIELVEVSLREKLVSAVGGGIAILGLMFSVRWVLPDAGASGVIASMGASAVLVFAVPHGPLSQPWPVVAGHGISALLGVLCALLIEQPFLAASVAVGLSIGAMHQLKCIHPPGGATAFTAVMGGSAIRQLGFHFVIFPVLANAVFMVAIAVLINGSFKWRRYPAILSYPASLPPSPSAKDATTPTHEEILAAVKSLDSFVDISEEELIHLVEILKRHVGKVDSDGCG